MAMQPNQKASGAAAASTAGKRKYSAARLRAPLSWKPIGLLGRSSISGGFFY